MFVLNCDFSIHVKKLERPLIQCALWQKYFMFALWLRQPGRPGYSAAFCDQIIIITMEAFNHHPNSKFEICYSEFQIHYSEFEIHIWNSKYPIQNSKYVFGIPITPFRIIWNSKYVFRIPNSIFQILNLDGSSRLSYITVPAL